MQNNWKRTLIGGSLLVGFFCAAGFVWLVTLIWYDYDSRMQDAHQAARQEAKQTCSQINDILGNIMSLADELAGQFSSQALLHDDIEAKLRRSLDLDPNMRAVGVAFSPFAFNKDLRLHSLAFEVREHGVVRIDVDATQDYTKRGPETEWYHGPIKKRTGVWLEPTSSPRGGTIQVTYAVPFFRADSDENPQGVLYFIYSAESLERLLNRMELGTDAYSFVLSPQGRFIFHPNRDLVDSQRTLFEIYGLKRDAAGTALARKAIAGQNVVGRATDPMTQLVSRVLYHPITAAGWSLGVVFDEHVLTSSPQSRQQYIGAGVLFVAAVAFFSLSLFRVAEGCAAALWGWVMLVSLLCPLCGIYTAFVVRAAPVEAYEQIANKASLRRFTASHNRKALRLRDKLPVYVPTGIYVQSATFTAANEVRLTGYIWQKYQPGIHDQLERGFILPETEEAVIEKPFVVRAQGMERWVWRFNVLVNQKFDYSRYPFSRENVWIQLWHKNFIHDVVLVPDLDSYKVTKPRALSGLRTGLELPGWNIDRTYFSYHMVSYQTSFGAPDYSGLTDFPELYFNIIVTKKIIGPAIAHFLPIWITYILLFSMLMLTTRSPEVTEILGFNTMNVVAACSGFFLVLIFLHIGLRNSLTAGGIVYVEYFYCITYAMILYLVGNSILFAGTDIGLIHYRDNLLPKLLFWPLSQLTALVLTVVSFY